MSLAPASKLTWLIRVVLATATLAFAVSTGPFAGHAETASLAEPARTRIVAVGDEIADLDVSPLTADDPAPLDLLPTQVSLVGPSPSRSKHVVADESLASFHIGHLERPPRPLSADSGHVDLRGA